MYRYKRCWLIVSTDPLYCHPIFQCEIIVLKNKLNQTLIDLLPDQAVHNLQPASLGTYPGLFEYH